MWGCGALVIRFGELGWGLFVVRGVYGLVGFMLVGLWALCVMNLRV